MSSSKEVMSKFYANHPNYRKEWRAKNIKGRQNEVVYCRNYQKERRHKIRELVNRAKLKPCCVCGVQYNPWVMDLDHINPQQKTINVAAMVRLGSKISDIEMEIAKCRVICSNCHREHTHNQQQEGII